MSTTRIRLAYLAALPVLVTYAGCRTDGSGLTFTDASVAVDAGQGSGGQGGTAGRSGSGGGPGGSPGSGGNGSGGNGSGGSGSGGAGGSPCGPSNCEGCCAGDFCITSTSTGQNACGLNGAACDVCTACETCESGACTVSPSSRWRLTCVSADISPTRPSGFEWDAGNNPDPRCQLVSGTTSSTPMYWPYNTVAPSWTGFNQASILLTASALTSGEWTATVVDCDGTGCVTTEQICAATGQALAGSDLQSGTYSFSSLGSCNTLTLGLACAQ